MSSWNNITLGELISLQRGHDLPNKTRGDGNIPVMGSFGPTGLHNKAKADGPGVTIGRSGASIGVASFISEPYWPLNTCMYVTDFKGNDPRFCYYLLSTLNLASHNSGSAQPSLNRNFIYPIEISVPDPDEQREIAAVLGALDDKIELNRKISETLEAMAQALYRSWFVDFAPVHARSQGLPPAGMDEATAALFPERFGDDGLPDGWGIGTYNDLIEFNPRERIKKGEIAPYLDMKALPTTGMIPDLAIPRAFTSGTKFRRGDTLLARITPCLENGKTALVQQLGNDEVGWGSTEFIVMRPRDKTPLAYPYCVARSVEFRDEAIASMTGSSGRQRADSKRVGSLSATLPPVEVLSAFSDLTSPMLARIAESGDENQTLSSLRDTLLPRLMSGELCVSGVREQVEEML